MTDIPSQNGDRISPLFNAHPTQGGDVATVEGVRSWVLEGLAQGATHTIIWCDTYDWTDFPQHVMPEENAREVVRKKSENEVYRLMEVYWLAGDLEAQLASRCNIDYGPES